MGRELTFIAVLLILFGGTALSQSPVDMGTIHGSVVDQSGGVVAKAEVTLQNRLTGYVQSALSGSEGAFQFVNIPPNEYRLEIKAAGFAPFSKDVTIRNSVPIPVIARLAMAGVNAEVSVEELPTESLEIDPSAHVSADRNLIEKLPLINPGAGLGDAIVYTTGGVAADGNGLFHPLGDHAQVSFIIDGMPIGDQQSKVFSTQLPASAVQSMELITGNPNAEFGDKTSLVAQVTTRSGLGAGRIFGNIGTSYGSFGSPGGSIGLGWGNERFGSFLAAEGVRSGRFLDTPEFIPIHDKGNNQTIFDRIDWQPGGRDTLHFNLFMARNWTQIPNDYDQLAQDQRQRVATWSIAPGYQHTFSPNTVLTVNPYVRKDQFNYYPSPNPFADLPATQSQSRQLLSWGARSDISTMAGKHNIKYGFDLKQSRLLEKFGFGLTGPAFNSPCVDSSGNPIPDPGLVNPQQCATLGYQPNIAGNGNVSGVPFSPGLLPFDLSRNGGLFNYHQTSDINQYAFYIQDGITTGNVLLNVGFRLDRYEGLASNTGPQPRAGLAYKVNRAGTVLRAAYARTFETPFNENLLLSSATGLGGLAQNVFGSVGVPIQPGFRNQFNTGLQQAVGKILLVDADYFWKYTHNAYDFNVLLNTTITFPIAWHNSKLDGITGRVSTTSLRGFQAYWTFGHTRARYFPPENGGLIFQGAPLAHGVFRIDHDQALQSTMNLRYQHKNAEWIAWTYRYDSGLVVSGIPDSAAATNASLVSPNQQASIGLACNGVLATATRPIRTCNGQVTSKLLTLPQKGRENDDHNPDRVKPRNILNAAIGSDNLLHWEGATRLTASVTIDNLTNKVALYNFLSTFSGTHFLQPRAVLARIGLTF